MAAFEKHHAEVIQGQGQHMVNNTDAICKCLTQRNVYQVQTLYPVSRSKDICVCGNQQQCFNTISSVYW